MLGGPMAAAIQAQTQALLSLLKQREDDLGLGSLDGGSSSSGSTGVKGAVQREKFQRLLETQPGYFSERIRANMARALGRIDAPGGVPDATVYTERFGCFQGRRELGSVM